MEMPLIKRAALFLGAFIVHTFDIHQIKLKTLLHVLQYTVHFLLIDHVVKMLPSFSTGIKVVFRNFGSEINFFISLD
jgi:hypothetical protein